MIPAEDPAPTRIALGTMLASIAGLLLALTVLRATGLRGEAANRLALASGTVLVLVNAAGALLGLVGFRRAEDRHRSGAAMMGNVLLGVAQIAVLWTGGWRWLIHGS